MRFVWRRPVKVLVRIPTLLGIDCQTGRLLGQTTRGLLPLYHYAPLQAAVLSGQAVPCAAHWPEHLKLFVYRYSPVPRLSPGQLPSGLADRFGSAARDSDGLRSWDQLTYRGWPLYVCTLDLLGEGLQGTVPDLFEQVDLNLLPLPTPGRGGQGP